MFAMPLHLAEGEEQHIGGRAAGTHLASRNIRTLGAIPARNSRRGGGCHDSPSFGANGLSMGGVNVGQALRGLAGLLQEHDMPALFSKPTWQRP